MKQPPRKRKQRKSKAPVMPAKTPVVIDTVVVVTEIDPWRRKP